MTYRADLDYLEPAASSEGSLLELLDHLLDRGVLLWGELRISVADVELIEVGLKLMLASARTADRWRQTTTQRASIAPGDCP
ncbi:gas vesicle protein GvpJ 2 [Bradyrhizobium oligotrophicum S58]|uniref:Gas vesicle protein GvpJ 2 n=1 Tax=Bradyrhizobium oligotrophicum S58 TaxID=1245469 RepID=M4Z3R6_9BRAD|nr:gas vesicle protein GvpJ [Bradyrhizobium oligotrophicum]BAM87507.1 gas vesicle protein GvpJ 2 [Bradyrhizobium oligotrophicum S58]